MLGQRKQYITFTVSGVSPKMTLVALHHIMAVLVIATSTIVYVRNFKVIFRLMSKRTQGLLEAQIYHGMLLTNKIQYKESHLYLDSDPQCLCPILAYFQSPKYESMVIASKQSLNLIGHCLMEIKTQQGTEIIPATNLGKLELYHLFISDLKHF